jgi:hypothetical protein
VDRSAEDRPSACRYAVLAVDEGHWLSSRIVTPRDETTPPKLIALASIDARPGAEIVIERDHGASTGFLLVLTSRNGLVQIRAHSFDGLFPYEGSLGHYDDVDCGKREGTIVTAGAGWAGGSFYNAERDLYRVERTRLRRIGRVVRHRVTDQKARAIFPSRSDSRPFASCALTRYPT